MKIANIIEEGKVGGPQIRMVRVAAAMDEAETLIVMPTANSKSFSSLCESAQVPYRTLQMTRITKEWREALKYIIFSPLEVVRLAWLFRKEQIDLVHASGGSWQYKGLLAARLAGIPSIWHLNDTQMPGWVRKLFRLFSPLPAGFIFASERSRTYYGTSLAERLQDVISSTVDARHFDPLSVPDGDEEVLKRLGDALVIGTVSNVNRIKGLETLIRAAARASMDEARLKVIVVGAIHANQRAYHAKLVTLAESLGIGDRIEWVGPRTDVRPLLKRMDVYICSSLAESSPASVWEAMAMGRPVVSTDVGDVGLHLADGKSGFLVPVGDDAAMAERILALLSNPLRRAQFGSLARETMLDAFSPTRIAEKTHAFYRRVCDSSRPRQGPNGMQRDEEQ